MKFNHLEKLTQAKIYPKKNHNNANKIKKKYWQTLKEIK